MIMAQSTSSDFTLEPVQNAFDHPSWVRRAMLIEQAAARYAAGTFTSAQRRAAEDLFRTALFDDEPLVRSVLADTLKRLDRVPRDIVVMLARDEAQVARPILQNSPLLTDEELVSFVNLGARSQRLAVAERHNLSLRVAEALFRTHDPIVVRRLLANDGAALAEGMLHAILDTLGGAAGIVEAMARRRILPLSIVERLAHYSAVETPRALPERSARLA
jgi:uncharacterized protein (DUF2336 family)